MFVSAFNTTSLRVFFRRFTFKQKPIKQVLFKILDRFLHTVFFELNLKREKTVENLIHTNQVKDMCINRKSRNDKYCLAIASRIS